MQSGVLSPHVFAHLLAGRLKESKPGWGKIEDNLTPDYYYLVSNNYRGGNKPRRDFGDGCMLVDTATEYLAGEHQVIPMLNLRDLRIRRLSDSIGILNEVIESDESRVYLRNLGFNLDDFSKKLEMQLGKSGDDLGDIAFNVAKIDRFLMKEITDKYRERKQPYDGYVSNVGRHSFTVNYFARKLSVPDEVSKFQSKLKMRKLFIALRNSYNIYHKTGESELVDRSPIDDGIATYHGGLIITSPEILQSRIRLMGEEIDLMFPGKNSR